jgi:hypothetical protein
VTGEHEDLRRLDVPEVTRFEELGDDGRGVGDVRGVPGEAIDLFLVLLRGLVAQGPSHVDGNDAALQHARD